MACISQVCAAKMAECDDGDTTIYRAIVIYGRSHCVPSAPLPGGREGLIRPNQEFSNQKMDGVNWSPHSSPHPPPPTQLPHTPSHLPHLSPSHLCPHPPTVPHTPCRMRIKKIKKFILKKNKKIRKSQFHLGFLLRG